MPVSAISASIAPAAATAQQDPQEPSPATEVQLESWAPKLKGSWDALGPLGCCRWDVYFRGKKHLTQSDSPASPLELPVQPSDP